MAATKVETPSGDLVFVPYDITSHLSKTLFKLTLSHGFYPRVGWNRSGIHLPRDQPFFYPSHYLDYHSCFTIKTLNLVFLYYSSYVALTSAYNPSRDGVWGLIAAIRIVVTLHLFTNSPEVSWFIIECVNILLTDFSLIIRCFIFESQEAPSWQVLALLLRKSPYLETLVIKMLKMYEYEERGRDVKQMRHFMENLRCLEVVKVKLQEDVRDEYLPLTSELTKLLSTASSKYKIQFEERIHF